MGEVYRARDTGLDRDVAIKVLPSSFASDAERLHRFAQEARAASALDHPNILTIHELGTHAGAPYIVAELLDGADLRTLAGSQPLAPRKVVDYALQIANGLAAAHEKGIVHRDLKPENLFVTRDGRVKILDFGLAKLGQTGGFLAGDLATQPGTRPGVVMGTVGYMSPEQVCGREADHRSDIFSFGVILYELLSGARAFARETAAETLTAVLKDEPPDLTATNERIHPALDRIVRRCLEKSPDMRFHSAHDLGFALSTLHTLSDARPGTVGATPGAQGPDARSGRTRERIIWAAASVLVALATFGVARAWMSPVPVGRPGALRLAVMPPEKTSFGEAVLSPDGHWLAFTGATGAKVQLWIRALDGATPRTLPGTEGAAAPFWSPDSRFIGFFAGGKLRKIEVSGGVSTALADVGVATGGAWNHEGVILYASLGGAGLSRVSAAGGDAVSVLRPDFSRQESDLFSPYFLPDGRHFLYNIYSGQKEHRGVFLGSLDDKVNRRLLVDNSNAVYAPAASGGGFLLFARESALLAQPFDAGTLQLMGEPLPVADQVGSNFDGTGGAHTRRNFTVSNTGLLAFDAIQNRQRSQLIWVDRDGTRTRILPGMDNVGMASLSPDGKRFAVARFQGDVNADVLVSDAAGGNATRLTFDSGNDLFPVWSPDGSDIAWASNRDGVFHIYRKASSGSGQDGLVYKSPLFKFPTDWSRDGRFIVLRQIDPKTHYDVWIIEPGSEATDRKAFAFLQTDANEGAAVLSPDGRWIAYASDESGRYEVYVQSFPTSGGKRQISTAGGAGPLWRGDGRELYFHAADGTLMAVPVEGGTSFATGASVALFEFRPGGRLLTPYYSATADGKRFLLSTIVETDGAAPLSVVINWSELLPRQR